MKNQSKRGAGNLIRKGLLVLLILFTMLLGGLIVGCEPENLSSLSEFAQVHACEYECVKARLQNQDLLKDYKSILIDLFTDGKFLLTVRPKKGKEKTLEGKYTMKDEDILFETDFFGSEPLTAKKTKEGFIIQKSLGGRLLFFEFQVAI